MIRIVDQSQIRMILHFGTVLICLTTLLSGSGGAISRRKLSPGHVIASITFVISLLTVNGLPDFSLDQMRALLLLSDFQYLFYCQLFIFAGIGKRAQEVVQCKCLPTYPKPFYEKSCLERNDFHSRRNFVVPFLQTASSFLILSLIIALNCLFCY